MESPWKSGGSNMYSYIMLQSTYVTDVTLLHLLYMLQATDALEIMLLSLVGPVLQCEWNLHGSQVALICIAT